MSPKVSVIMNCYNSATYLKEAIDSVYAQSYSNWEIIFWDNQSSDNSAEIAKSYDDRLKYYCSDCYLKLGEGRNKALEKVTGDYIAFLDCDDQWLPQFLEHQTSLLDNDKDLGVVYSNFLTIFDNVKEQKLAISKKHPSGHVFLQALSVYPVGILTAVIRRDVLSGLTHYFDPKLNLVEDYDFFMRIIADNKAAYTSDPLAIYRNHSNNHTNRYKADFPDELIYTLEKFKKLYPSYQDVLLQLILEQRIKKVVYQHVAKGFFLSFFMHLRKDNLLTVPVFFKWGWRFFKMKIKRLLFG
ncbi:glycosyl transferase family 2 [Candidatus Marinamargulisbacteria bacterium SCGC AG-439-L15]|nr:glycosyl transferase family 2 [Candidatus Marinamargulisbacteria bacterium SCGC AG-439-L15]